MNDRKLIKATAVAEKLGHKLDWFYRNRKRLEKEQGFPERVPGCGPRWDPAAIDLWLDTYIPDHKIDNATVQNNGIEISKEESERIGKILERRAEKIAEGVPFDDDDNIY